ncbi:MAG: nucleotidyltransferase family protein [Chloroflexota bacterium]
MTIDTDVVAVVLAAGAASRMGRAKQLLPWGRHTILEQTLHNVRKSRIEQTVVVTGHRADDVAALARRAGATVVHNENYEEGEMLSSLQVAVAQLPADCAGVLVMLADQPQVEAQTINSLLAAFQKGRGDIIAPTYEGRRGNPVLIGKRFFDELLALPLGAAPRDLLRRHPEAVQLVPVASDSILLDIDRPADYERHRPKGDSS